MLLKHESMFHSTADWLFFEAGHGMGPFDGEGVSKRPADEAVNRKQVTVIHCAEEYFKWKRSLAKSKMSWYQGMSFSMRKQD